MGPRYVDEAQYKNNNLETELGRRKMLLSRLVLAEVSGTTRIES